MEGSPQTDWLLDRDKSGKRLVDVASFPGKGRGLISTSALPANVLVVLEECAFLRIAEAMCVKCRVSGHSIATCPEEKERVAPLLKQFVGCEGLLSHFFIPRPLLSDLLATLTDGSVGDAKREESLARLYVAAPPAFRERISLDEFVKLYHVRWFCCAVMLIKQVKQKKICERNAHTISSVNGMGKKENVCEFLPFVDAEIKGVFPLHAMLNHSCRPNAVYVSLPGTTSMCLKTLRAVQAGEELTVSYISNFLPVGLRQKILSDRYGFSCCCELCSNSFPDRTRAFVCGGSCPGPVCPDGRGDGRWSCLCCNRVLTAKEIAARISAEVYPQLHAKLIANAKDPALMLSWEKLKDRALLSPRHWMIYFGQSELLKSEPELVACRMIDALLWRLGDPDVLCADDLSSLLGILARATSSQVVKESAFRWKTLIDLAIRSADETNREQQYLEASQIVRAHISAQLKNKH